MKKILTILIVVAAVVSLSYGSWYLYQNNRKASETSVNDTSQAQTTSGDKYFVIKELGIRFALPESLRGDITYVVNDQANRDFGGPVRYDFISKSFNNSPTKCELANTSQQKTLVSIYEEAEGQGNTQDPAPFKQLGSKRYYFTKTSCEEVIEQSGSTTDKQRLDDLKEALSSTLESIY